MTYFFNPRFILAHLTDLIISVVAAEKIGKEKEFLKEVKLFQLQIAKIHPRK